MKKTLVLVALILTIATSVVAGTLAIYNVNLGTIAEGSVAAKNFVFTKAGNDTFVKDVKIAPSESTQWQVAVKNFDGATVTETPMTVTLDFTVSVPAGKTAITPLVVTVTGNGQEKTILTGAGAAQITFDLAANASVTETFTVNVAWPTGTVNNGDTAFQANGAALVTVTAAAVQKIG